MEYEFILFLFPFDFPPCYIKKLFYFGKNAVNFDFFTINGKMFRKNELFLNRFFFKKLFAFEEIVYVVFKEISRSYGVEKLMKKQYFSFSK